LDRCLIAIRIFKGVPGEPRPLLRAGVRLCLMTMRILIVEDEEHLGRLLAEVLGREGYATETASGSRSGLT
jgi:hypothetical protein